MRFFLSRDLKENNTVLKMFIGSSSLEQGGALEKARERCLNIEQLETGIVSEFTWELTFP